MALIVSKFGGTSVASPERIKNVAKRLIAMKQEGADVVVKSMGEDSKDFHGIILEMKALGYDEPVTYERDADTMTIHAPFVQSDMPVVYRMKLK